jgi:flagellar motor component MotA
MSLFFVVLVSFVFGSFSIHFLILTYSYFIVLGGSIIACHCIERHIAALESDIDVLKSILLPIRKHEQEHTSQHLFQTCWSMPQR